MEHVNGWQDSLLEDAVDPPDLKIPNSNVAVDLKIIDSTSRLTAPMHMFIQPPIEGHEQLDCPSFAFLIQHPTGRKVLFDIGTRKDVENLPPAVLKIFTEHSLGAQVQKDVFEILEEHEFGVSQGAIEAVIWSHWHYDHIGDISKYPASTDLVVGPGFKEAFIPGYPLREDGLIRQSDYEGRELKEISFDATTDIRIGGFLAHDFFGDGSFYLLDTPGHAIGHICGLARVTAGQGSDSTFVFMGGDACHHGGEFRPTKFLPLPKRIKLPPTPVWPTGICPGDVMQKLHFKNDACSPFYDVSQDFPLNREQLLSTIDKMQEFDAAPNVFVVLAHDQTLLDMGMDMFPKSVNDWKSKAYDVEGRWGFLNDFAKAAEKFL
ncbi:hypothetical protein LTR84_007500 [Exophiala bonariae]|uniref:Metallo-beta-lactamase domain-containing protein n=1 Tax=Exophiala bonariae TaxID=1690606 RepID=A0AAV9N1N9_9EURO|nr:hypothetical protein LTR84_007500 [Exophiala bonariae]